MQLSENISVGVTQLFQPTPKVMQHLLATDRLFSVANRATIMSWSTESLCLIKGRYT